MTRGEGTLAGARIVGYRNEAGIIRGPLALANASPQAAEDEVKMER
jgi:hypothetical protein